MTFVSGLPSQSTEFSKGSLALSKGALEPTYGVWDSVTDSFMSSFIGRGDTLLANAALSAAPVGVLSPEALKEQYGIVTDSPMNQFQASLIKTSRDRERRIGFRSKYLDETIENGTAYSMMANLASGVAGGVISPTNIALSYATGGLNLLVGGAIEGVFENVAGRHMQSKYGMEYSNLDGAIDFFAPVAFGATVSGIKSIRKTMRGRARRLEGQSIPAIAEGKIPGSLVNKAYTQDVVNKSKSAPMVTTEPKVNKPMAGDTRMYAARLGDDYSGFNSRYSNNGVVLVDSQDVAAKNIAPSIESTKGEVVNKSINDANIVQGSEPIQGDLRKNIEASLKKTEYEYELEDSNIDGSLDEFMTNISKSADLGETPELLDIVEKAIRDSGYDGFSFNLKDLEGNQIDTESRGVHLFDGDKFKAQDGDEVSEAISGESTNTKQLVKEENDYLESPESRVFYNRDLSNEIENTPVMPADKEIKSNIQDNMQELEDMIEGENPTNPINPKEGDSPSLKVKKEIESKKQMMKAGIHCVRNS